MDRPEDRRRLTHTEEYHPYPAEGLDVDAARGRVEANPEVMPPHPSPRTRRSWQNREFFGMRALPILGTIGAALALPLLVGWLSRSRPRHEKHEHMKHGHEHGRWGRYAKRRRHAAMEEKGFMPEWSGEEGFSKWAKKAAKTGMPIPPGMPRFVVLASRPWGRKGRKARALILGKVAH